MVFKIEDIASLPGQGMSLYRFQLTVSIVGPLHLHLIYAFICSLLPQLDFIDFNILFVFTMSSVRGLREKLLSTVF